MSSGGSSDVGESPSTPPPFPPPTTSSSSSSTPPTPPPTPPTWSSWWASTVASTVENAQILAASTVAKAHVIAEQAQPYIEHAKIVAQEKANVIAQETKVLYEQSVTQVNTIATQYQQTYSSRSSSNNNNSGRALDLQYITENVISMAFPAGEGRNPAIPGSNDINRVAAHLKLNHGGHFMIWNISEESYDYGVFDDQVLEYKFPGHPSPPLYLLFKICTSIESWLDADERNVAVIHCLTGKGRTTTLIACVLAWLGEFPTPAESLYYIADIRKIPVEYLTIPSQKRYIQYFSNALEHNRPRAEPLVLRRILFNTIPVFGNRGERGGDESESNYGCCPYIQLFKSGKLIATAAPIDASKGTNVSITEEDNKDNGDRSKRLQLQWIPCSEGNMSFSIDQAIQGDILMRCRHVGDDGGRISMFRLAFHTGYVPIGDVLRLTKAQLDGPTTDMRFDDEFFIDLIFAPVTPPTPPPTISDDRVESSSSSSSDGDKYDNLDGGGETSNLPPPPKYTEVKNVFTSSAVNAQFATAPDTFESLLNESDSGFWDQVSIRKTKCINRKARKFSMTTPTSFSIIDEAPSSSSPTNRGGNNSATTTGIIPSSSLPTINPNGVSKAPTSATILHASVSQRSANANLTDEELILKMSISDNSSGGGGGGHADSDALDDDMEEFIRNLSAEGGLSPLENPNNINSSSSSSSRGSKNSKDSGSILSPNTINAVVKDELDALEELERVLGLDEVKTSGRQLNKASPKVSKSAVADNGNDGASINAAEGVEKEEKYDDNDEEDSTWLTANATNDNNDKTPGLTSPSPSATSINIDDLDDLLGSDSNNTSFKSPGGHDNIEDFNDIETYFASLESPVKSNSNS